MPNCTRPPSLALAVINLNMYIRKKSPCQHLYLSRRDLPSPHLLPVFAQAENLAAEFPIFHNQIGVMPRTQGRVGKSCVRVVPRLFAHPAIPLSCRAAQCPRQQIKLGKTDALVMCNMREGGDVYLNPVMGRIKTSPASFVFPLSLRPVRASHLRPCRSSSHLRVTSVTAAGPVRVSGS